MSIIIEGFVGKQIYNNGKDFKIYSFYPSAETKNLVKAHEVYNNISISGTLPTLIDKVKYKMEIEETVGAKYKNSYTFKKMLTDTTLNGDYKEKFLKSLVTERQYDSLIKSYPDIINMIIEGKDIDTSVLVGIGDKIMEKIKSKVIDNFALAGLVSEYMDFGMTFAMLRKLFDTYKSTELIKEKMESDPYGCLCSINRVGFKTADQYILKKFPQFIDSAMRCKACLQFVIQKNEADGNTWIEYNNLYRLLKENASQTSHHFNEIISKDEEFFFHTMTRRISLAKTYMCEREVCNKLLEFNSRETIMDISLEKYNMVHDFPLSDEQRQIQKNICTKNLNLLVGWGGTGKSFSTKALVDMLEDNMITYALMSPTGKASKVLKENTGREATTIHRGLKYMPGKGFTYNQDNRLPHDVIIIDEYSMIDIFLLRDLLRAIRDDAKIIFIGDPDQIPSVGVGNIAYDMLQSQMIATSQLTQIFRYGEGGLSYVVAEIRKGNSYFKSNDKIQTFGEKKDYTFVNASKEETIPSLKTLYKKLLNQGVSVDDIMVLSGYNVGEFGTIAINNILQEMVNPNVNNKPQVVLKKNEGEIIFRLHDKVMQTNNDYKIETIDGQINPIMNGDIGTIVAIEEDTIHIEFDGRICVYDKSNLYKMSLAYALSIHKSQGSQSPYVILVTPPAHVHFLNRNLLYVGAGRTKKALYHIGTIATVKSILKKSENTNRDTWLLEMLKGEI